MPADPMTSPLSDLIAQLRENNKRPSFWLDSINLDLLLSVIEEYRRALVEIVEPSTSGKKVECAERALSRGDQLAKGEAPSHE